MTIKCCKDCPDRFRDLETNKDCHDSCKRYIEESEKLREYRKPAPNIYAEGRVKDVRSPFGCTKRRVY